MALLLASSSGLEQQNKESNVKVRETAGCSDASIVDGSGQGKEASQDFQQCRRE